MTFLYNNVSFEKFSAPFNNFKFSVRIYAFEQLVQFSLTRFQFYEAQMES